MITGVIMKKKGFSEPSEPLRNPEEARQMFRHAMNDLIRWKQSSDRKPLIIRGARQVGKTWLMKEFGRLHYEQTVYINFENNGRMKTLFEGDLNPDRLISGIELVSGQKADPEKTLLIFDEVQEVPRALTSLKYFNEDAPEYQIVCAGSLLGIALHPGTSFPVGKVTYLDLYPLSFLEFLSAVEMERFAEVLLHADLSFASAFRQDYERALKEYYFTGGMPEVVRAFAQNRDFDEVREIQRRILASYEQDFSKHAPNEIVPRIRMLWNSIPGQLSRENKKFVYGLIREGARAREYEQALLWLSDCGLVHQLHRVSVPGIPLKIYEDLKAFKLYLADVGLLSCMAGLRKETILDGSGLFVEFKGALTEQYVMQQLVLTQRDGLFYWSAEKGTAEVDFLMDWQGIPVPIEVKAETNLQAKSLKVFREKYQPKISVRTSLSDYKEEEWLLNLPLWAVDVLPELLKKVRNL